MTKSVISYGKSVSRCEFCLDSLCLFVEDDEESSPNRGMKRKHEDEEDTSQDWRNRCFRRRHLGSISVAFYVIPHLTFTRSHHCIYKQTILSSNCLLWRHRLCVLLSNWGLDAPYGRHDVIVRRMNFIRWLWDMQQQEHVCVWSSSTVCCLQHNHNFSFLLFNVVKENVVRLARSEPNVAIRWRVTWAWRP